MTIATLNPELSVMWIIIGVTTAAVSGNGRRRFFGVLMAGGAAQTIVTAIKSEIGVYIMIEYGGAPAIAGMTVSAVRTQRSAMSIVVRMTSVTVSWSACELLGLMTAAAGNWSVQSRQRKAGQVMIECDRIQPRGLHVAKAAVLVHLPAVRVIHGVTALTVRWWLLLNFRLVTADAVNLRMRIV